MRCSLLIGHWSLVIGKVQNAKNNGHRALAIKWENAITVIGQTAAFG